jgi:hypothetical protein
MAIRGGIGLVKNGLISFTHGPLDQSKSSIRILRSLSKRSEFGLIQCELVHTTVDASYTCLSYVWGSPETERLVLVNGKLFIVRENLHQFLCAATKEIEQSTLTWFWIDALCIDQSNTTERNRQVAQMGTIYSQAQGVSIWMGTHVATTRLLNTALDAWALMELSATFAEFQAAGSNASICNQQVAADWAAFLTHAYWTGAWITQEVLLARTVIIQTDKISVRGEQLRPICYLKHTLTDEFSTTRLFGDNAVLGARSMKYFEEIFLPRHRKERSILELLNDYPDRKCELSRDQIHSLAFLASDGPQVPVNYAMQDRDFLYSSMKGLRASMTCMCSVSLLAATLGHLQKAGEKGTLTLSFVLTLEMGQPGGFFPREKGRNRQLFASLSSKPTMNSTRCSGCGILIRKRAQNYACLQAHCSSMRGHIVGISQRLGHCETEIRTLALDLGETGPSPFTSRPVKVNRTNHNTFSLCLYADELIYLVQNASMLRDLHSSTGICSRTAPDGSILRLL